MREHGNKLSDGWKRMTTPTDAQIEVRYELRYGKFGAYFYDLSEESDLSLQEILNKLNDATAEIRPSEPECIEALDVLSPPPFAAAEVGDWKSTAKNNAMQVLAERNAELAERLKTTIERCAKVAHDWLEQHGYEVEAIECARAILALKEIDDDKCISEHLYQHTGQCGSKGQLMRCEKCGKGKWVPW
jgi:hypothetical protein